MKGGDIKWCGVNLNCKCEHYIENAIMMETV